MAITDPALIGLFKSGRQKKYSVGELIMQGDDPSGVMLITEGFVKVYSISDDGDEYVHVLYKAGEMFPLIWALKDVRRRIFYEAASAVTISLVSKDGFISLIESDAKAAYDVMSQLALQFYIMADRLDNLGYKSAHERVAYRIVFLASRFGERRGDSVLIKAPVTHTFISASINLARETVSREIEKMERDGILGKQNGYILIKDIRKLSGEFSEPLTLDLWGLEQS